MKIFTKASFLGQGMLMYAVVVTDAYSPKYDLVAYEKKSSLPGHCSIFLNKFETNVFAKGWCSAF